MTAIHVGDRAPEFSVTAHTGEPIRLSDFRNDKVVVLFFYPRDGTPVCTKEACAFRDHYEQFVEAGAQVIGVSSSSEGSHQTFAALHSLPFPLISDRDGSLRKAFGVPKTLGFLPGRVTYVIDQQGIVRMAFSAQMTADRHVTEALDMVRQLVASC
ncbi:MAG: peroxiredoxin [Thermoguttaceae bacterium]|jgi:peroxiredoxin Q/BCP|nr:peroxiredoxin [Thermoguttaceae bacterium]